MAFARRIYPPADDHPTPASVAEPSNMPTPLPQLHTIDDVNAAIIEIDRQRVAAMEIVAGEMAAENALLERDAPDEAFVELTRKVRSARRLLSRLDAQEGHAIDVAQRLDGELRQREWSENYRPKYVAIAMELAQSAACTARLRTEIQQLSAAAHRAGFGSVGEPALPVEHVLLPLDVLVTYHNEWSGRLPATAPPRTDRGAGRIDLGNRLGVKFTRDFPPYAAGATADLPAERARALVANGYAEPFVYNPFGGPAA